MHIVVVGLNYRTAPVEVRERFTFAEKDLSEALQKLKLTKSVLEGVIVATCNRTELYVVVDRLHMCGYFIRTFMEQWFNVPREEFTQHLYIYEDDQAMRHLFRVICGLDSMVIGETQILGQVKQAFSKRRRKRQRVLGLTSCLNRPLHWASGLTRRLPSGKVPFQSAMLRWNWASVFLVCSLTRRY